MALSKKDSHVSSLSAGPWHIKINDDQLDSSYTELEGFLQSLNELSCRNDSDTHCQVLLTTANSKAHTFVDSDQSLIYLQLPLAPVANMHVARIALLQAAFRGLALLVDDPALVLLHGSAVAARDSQMGIGVIDGGAGAGKTSLSLALTGLGYSLITDEFLVCEAKNDHLVTFSQPNLPWHIRPDMAPHLSIKGNKPGLHALPQLTAARKDIPIRVLVIPDWSIPVTTCVIEPGKPPESCVSDHLRKFADPSLDHVSLFDRNSDSLAVSVGSYRFRRLLEHRINTMKHSLFGAASSLTLLRVGIGSPSEINLAAQAVSNRLENLEL